MDGISFNEIANTKNYLKLWNIAFSIKNKLSLRSVIVDFKAKKREENTIEWVCEWVKECLNDWVSEQLSEWTTEWESERLSGVSDWMRE